MPRLEKYSPSPLLQKYVKGYTLFEGPNTGIVNTVPTWNKFIIGFQFGGSIKADVNGRFETVSPASINGLITKPYQLLATDLTLRFFFVELTPIGLYMLLKENGENFVDASVDAFSVVPVYKQVELIEALAEVYDMKKKSLIVDQFLLQLLPSEGMQFRVRHVVDCLQLIEESKGQLRISEIADELGFSERFIHKKFHEVTGVSPKSYARVTRFMTNFNAVMDNQGRLPSLPPDTNYYDQSHFIKEFKSFTGYSPSNLPKASFMFARLFT